MNAILLKESYKCIMMTQYDLNKQIESLSKDINQIKELLQLQQLPSSLSPRKNCEESGLMLEKTHAHTQTESEMTRCMEDALTDQKIEMEDHRRSSQQVTQNVDILADFTQEHSELKTYFSENAHTLKEMEAKRKLIIWTVWYKHWKI